MNITQDNIALRFLNLATEQLIKVNRRYIIGASILEDNYTAWFNNEALHSPAISLNAMHNALLRTFSTSSEYRIDVTNHPLPYKGETKVRLSLNMIGLYLTKRSF